MNTTVSKNTKIFQVDSIAPESAILEQCGQIIRAGGLVAFPTETVYGLGANALDGEACYRIFAAKGRPQDNPLIVHVASPEDISQLTSGFSPLAEQCIARFWPGPLTLVLPKAERIPREVTAGLDTVAIRMPDHPVALNLITRAGVPIAAPSANISGRPSPTLAEHVIEDLGGRIDAVLAAGPCRVGVESTVLDLSEGVPTILRPGGITREELAAVLGEVKFDPALTSPDCVPRSPGQKYLHYAPKGKVILIEGPAAAVQAKVNQELQSGRQQGLKVGILSAEESSGYYQNLKPDYLAVLGSREQPWQVAAGLYRALRECDSFGIELILAETFASGGMGAAVMNRLEKAAGYRKIVVH